MPAGPAITLARMENDVVTEHDRRARTPSVEEELLVEEISIDGMCGVY